MSKKPYLFLIVMLCLLLAVPVVLAQIDATPGGPIAYDQAITGEITNDTSRIGYTFEGSAGDVIVISMVAQDSNLDSYLELYDSSEQMLTYDDDSGGSLNSLIGPYTLPADDTYTVVATRCCGRGTGGSEGAFRLVLISQPELQSLALNQPLTVELDGEQPVAFLSLSGLRGIFSLTGESTTGESSYSVIMRDAVGGYIGVSYSTPDGRVYLDPLYLPAEADYQILVRRERQMSMIGIDAPEATPGALSVSLMLTQIETEAITLAETISGTLDNDNPADHYRFSAERGELLRLSGRQTAGDEPGGFEVRLFSPEGYQFSGAGTYMGGEDQTGFTVDPIRLEFSGEYLMTVNRIDMGGQGTQAVVPYTVTLGPTQTAMLQPGVEVSGTFDENAMDRVYRYNGTAGETVRITIRNQDYGMSVNVEAPRQEEVMDSGLLSLHTNVATSASYEVTLPATGTYIFRLYSQYYGPEPEVMPRLASFQLMIETLD
jgi:hypothetical protein